MGGNVMNKKHIAILSAISIVIIGVLIWLKAPINIMELNPENILEIVMFDGNTGSTLIITDTKDVFYITKNLNSIKLIREKLSLGYTGYSFKTILYGNDGEELDGWNNFIINSEDSIRKDPFFYRLLKVA